MKTSEAVQALRPLSNWAKSISKLEEVLDLILEKESVIEKGEARLESLTTKIEAADKQYSSNQQRNKESITELEQLYFAKLKTLEDDLDNKKKLITAELTTEENYLKEFKESSSHIKNKFQDELAVLTNLIRDKKKELEVLSQNLTEAIMGTQRFIGANKSDDLPNVNSLG